jgi:putative transposase
LDGQRQHAGQVLLRGHTAHRHAHRQLLDNYPVTVSMSRTGNCYDNAPMESFFSSLKCEQVHHQRYQTRAEARNDIFSYIETFYNRKRRHSSLGYVSPEEYELQLQLLA